MLKEGDKSLQGIMSTYAEPKRPMRSKEEIIRKYNTIHSAIWLPNMGRETFQGKKSPKTVKASTKDSCDAYCCRVPHYIV